MGSPTGNMAPEKKGKNWQSIHLWLKKYTAMSQSPGKNGNLFVMSQTMK